LTRRIALRAAGLVVLAVGLIVGLTIYYSADKVPPCIVSGAPKWRAPTDKALHRFELVVPDRAICLFDIDNGHALVGALKLPGISGIEAVTPRDGRLAVRYAGGKGALVDLVTGQIRKGVGPPARPSARIVVRDLRASVEYVTKPGELGFRVFRLDTHRLVDAVRFAGFTWNPRFGPNPPDHGMSLAPDRPELWVLDAPNNAIHVFDVSGARPQPITDLHLTKPLSGEENPCARLHCERLGSLQHSADGRLVYVGDSGDVFDVRRREEIANLEALHESRVMLEADWVNGVPDFPAAR
jgi:hypothetical protein